MATTETRNGTPEAVKERLAQELSDKVTRQVSEILEEADREKKVRQPALAYRIPSAGVRYYF